MVPPTDAEVIDTAYLNTLESERAKTSWITTVVIDGKEVSFKLDTGAEVTMISDKTLKALGAKELQSSTKRLCGPDQRPIEVMGEFQPLSPTRSGHVFTLCLWLRNSSKTSLAYLQFRH